MALIAVIAGCLYLWLAGVGRGQSQAFGQNATPGRADSKIQVYDLKIAAKERTLMERNAYSKETVPAAFSADGTNYQNIRIRYRGAWARSWPKKPMKIFLDKDKPFEGRHTLNLNSGWRDPAFIRETLGYYVYAEAGVPASKSRLVHVNLNGQFRGLYVEVEQVDKAFLKRQNLKGASVFKAMSHANSADERDLGNVRAFQGHYENETSKTGGLDEIQKFCHDLATTPNVLDFFNRRVDLDKYTSFLAVTALIQNWDTYNKNHYIACDTEGSKKWFPIPWDLDRTFGDHWQGGFSEARLPVLLGTSREPGVTGWNRMADRYFSEPVLRERFLNRLQQLLQTVFTKEKLFPVIDRMESQIVDDVALDRRHWPGTSPNLHAGIKEVKQYIEDRRSFLLSQIGSLRKK